ncbi:TPA: MATE family efflux transporter [Candidatus Poribacteria bacterium]|nr:MATE family efflux transporter [Candidatus Poribacteria bacterium]
MNREILRLAIPNIISNVSVPMLSAVDLMLMGHLSKEQHLGAVAVGGVAFNVIYWGFGFLRMSTTGMTAQAYGADDSERCLSILKVALLFAFISSLLLIISYPIIVEIIFLLIEASSEVEQLAKVYFRICIFAVPATLALHAFHGWFLGMQNARHPMILAIIVNSVNIVLSVLFVKVFQMRSDGVALGTACAQYFGLFLAIVLFLYRYRKLLGNALSLVALDLSILRQFLIISRDIFIRTLCLVLSHAFFTSKSALISDAVLAVNAILLQFIIFVAYAVDGFAFATESLVGKYKGALDYINLKLAVKYAFAWAYIFGCIFSLTFLVVGENILRLFTNQEVIITQAIPYMIWVVLAPIINIAPYIWDGVFLGATATPIMRNAMICSTLCIFLPSYYLFIPYGNHGLWFSLTLLNIARGISLSLLAPKHIFKYSS